MNESLSARIWVELGFDEPVGALARPAMTLREGSATAEDLDRRFKADSELDCIVILANERPRFLVTREHYYGITGGPFGFALFQKKPAESVSKPEPLVVDEGEPARNLARRALERARSDQYDPILITDARGTLRGVVTIQQLILKAAQIEVQVAQLANPLTGLPTGRAIEGWVERGLEQDIGDNLTVVFVDLDRFGEFNEAFGLLRGDQLVLRTAEVLAASLDRLSRGVRLGHAGGDDFVIVSPRPVSVDGLRQLCATFDREKLELFQGPDRERGHYFAANERGERVRVPLTTLSIASVSSSALGPQRHPAVFSQAGASLHRSAKALSAALCRSTFAFL